ncbi:MAG: bifunctional 2-polyprenyl-6-hydroxyphenol methylase/3-demethylubiquinol 3-O-methyltransferase UbiG [Chromatiales bacterium]|nr:bifunctional 2-polyprenyl-6-hydroxyphenol methylase/3-demethylubiquinol 3-O-methyltransferase UbiG [Chromatiales bacterium]
MPRRSEAKPRQAPAGTRLRGVALSTDPPPGGTPDANVDEAEVARFSALASRWWDPDGEFRPLHRLNPVRTGYVADRVRLAGAKVVDVGCGGGLLSESLAARGADVLGIDASEEALAAARAHLEASGLDVEYRATTAEALAETLPGRFDVVTCMELIEHVPDGAALVAACARLARPGGTVVFSTISRTPKAYALAIVAAEYVLGMLPKGTHDYARFVRPSELARWGRAAHLRLGDVTGVAWSAAAGGFRLRRDPSVNYLATFEAPAGGEGDPSVAGGATVP